MNFDYPRIEESSTHKILAGKGRSVLALWSVPFSPEFLKFHVNKLNGNVILEFNFLYF